MASLKAPRWLRVFHPLENMAIGGNPSILHPLYFEFSGPYPSEPARSLILDAFFGAVFAEKKTSRKVQPVFITIDPERDSGKLIKDYVREFHPRMIGLRGSLEEVKKVAKLFRVYFMKTNDSKTDYLVDHSIIMVRPSLICIFIKPCEIDYGSRGTHIRHQSKD